jgi:methionyl-tRNA formyltransferase
VRVIFMGTPQFGVPSLQALAAHYDVVAAFTRPDAVSGRGASRRPSAVKSIAMSLGIEVREPRTLRDAQEIDYVRSLQADVAVVAAYGLMLPPEILEIPRLGVVNVHGSLLPRWRGAAPVQRAILAGDAVTGVSIMRVEAGMDTGPYCAQARTSIADKNAPALMAELAQLGSLTLLDALAGVFDGSAVWTPQDESMVTYADKVAKSDVAISPELTAHSIVRRVRASMPAAPSRTVLAGRGVTILDARPAEEVLEPGTIANTKTALLLGASDGSVEVCRIKPDGKAEMDAAAWARGISSLSDATWEASL